MRKIWWVLLAASALGLASCGGGGGISGTPDQPKTITVNIVETSATVEVGETFQFHGSVDNATNTTMTWMVNEVIGGNSTAGTISFEGLYTAPAAVPNPATVTVKAMSNADNTKWDTAAVTINPKFAISPASVALEVGKTQQFTANEAVASNGWWVNDTLWGNETVGTINSTGLYTAPAVVPNPATVTVKAILASNNSKSATASVTITPLGKFSISPLTVTVPAGGSQTFVVSLAEAAVNWTVGGAAGTDPATWGTVSSTGVYTAPITPPWTGKVNVTASLKSDPTQTANAVVTVVFSNATLNGHYAFQYRSVGRGDASSAEHVWALGSFVADGKGGLSNGAIDINIVDSSGSVPSTATFTGIYTVGADGRTVATLNVVTPTGTETAPLRWVMVSNKSARMIGFDDTGSGWGRIDQQDPASFSTQLSGEFAFYYDGVNGTQTPAVAAGILIAADEAITFGTAVFNDDLGISGGRGVWQSNFDGSYTSADPATGRGTWTLSALAHGTTYQYAFYQLNASSFVFSSLVPGMGVLGTAIRQNGTDFSDASLAGNMAMLSTGYSLDGSNVVANSAAGVFTADGKGSLTSGVVDINMSANLPATGTYDIPQNALGVGHMEIDVGGGSNPVVIFMIAPQQLFFVSTSLSVASTGQFMPQSAGPYDANSLRGTWAFVMRGTTISLAGDASGQFTTDGAGNLTGKADMNIAGMATSDVNVTGTYMMAGNGRGDLTLNLGGFEVAFGVYMASGQTAFLVQHGTAGASGVAYRQF